MTDRKFRLHDGQKGSAIGVRVTPRASQNEVVSILDMEKEEVQDRLVAHLS